MNIRIMFYNYIIIRFLFYYQDYSGFFCGSFQHDIHKWMENYQGEEQLSTCNNAKFYIITIIFISRNYPEKLDHSMTIHKE